MKIANFGKKFLSLIKIFIESVTMKERLFLPLTIYALHLEVYLIEKLVAGIAIRSPALLLTSKVTWGKSLNLPGPQNFNWHDDHANLIC